MNAFFTHSSGANQQRQIKNMITGAVVATYETGNEVSRAAAIQTANNSNAATLGSLVDAGLIVKNRPYELGDLQRAYAALNA